MKGGPLWNRLAAATGIAFAAIGAALSILAQVKDYEDVGDIVDAGNETWGVYVLLLGFATLAFVWFTGIFVARLRQVEAASGTSGRLANVVQGSGSAIAAALTLTIASQWAGRQLDVPDLAELSTAILEGPTLAFLIAAYIGAAGLVVFRAGETVSPPSRIVAQVSLLVAPAFLALGGIQLFNNYAWIDETGEGVFLAWVLAVSVVGVQRWGSIDEGWEPSAAPAPVVVAAGPEPLSRTASEPDGGGAKRRAPVRRKAAPARKTPARKAPRKR